MADRNENNAESVKKRFDGFASGYDSLERLGGGVLRRWRTRVWSQVKGGTLLEVGIGTGGNIPYHPAEARVTGIDVSEKMLERARRKAKSRGRELTLDVMDVQSLAFPDDSFDGVVETLVFCSVPDPIRGLNEIARVVKPGGRVVLMEHMRSDGRLMGPLMDFVNPLSRLLMGEDINRRTVENVERSNLVIDSVENLDRFGIFRLIRAHKGQL